MKTIVLTVDEQGIATLELNRPEVLNVLSLELMNEVSAALRSLVAEGEARALIVTGRGRGFCAGADLSAIGDAATSGEGMGKAVSQQMRDHFNPMMELLYRFPLPVISAINGIAAGGGAGIALCADIVLAANSAALKVVQVPQLGIVADLGANWLLPRLAGRSRAMGACLTGDTLPASRLLEWGMVWECVEDDLLLQRAREMALKLARVPAQTVVATRQLIDRAPGNSFEGTLEDERLCQERLCDAPFFSESVSRFLGS